MLQTALSITGCNVWKSYEDQSHLSHGCGPEVHAPKILSIENGLWLVKHPAAPGGSLWIIHSHCVGDVRQQSTNYECQQDSMAPRTCVADIKMIPPRLNLQQLNRIPSDTADEESSQQKE